jgi:hypothetical protein
LDVRGELLFRDRGHLLPARGPVPADLRFFQSLAIGREIASQAAKYFWASRLCLSPIGSATRLPCAAPEALIFSAEIAADSPRLAALAYSFAAPARSMICLISGSV